MSHKAIRGSTPRSWCCSRDNHRLTFLQTHLYVDRNFQPGNSIRFHQAILSNRSVYNFSDEDHIYMIPQSFFKFHPAFDNVILKLLTLDPIVWRLTEIH